MRSAILESPVRVGTKGELLLPKRLLKHVQHHLEAIHPDSAPTDRSEMLLAMGSQAAAAGEGWREIRTAEVPRDAALLALARDMCHEPRPG